MILPVLLLGAPLYIHVEGYGRSYLIEFNPSCIVGLSSRGPNRAGLDARKTTGLLPRGVYYTTLAGNIRIF